MRLSNTMLALVALNCSLTVSALGQNRPNLIFILTDDQGVESIEGPYWSNEMGCETPTLRELAKQGVSFTNCRVNPNCSPTRAALMTGRNACDTGVNGVLGRFTGGENPCTGDPLEGDGARVTNRLGLQTHEKTIAEVLRYLEEDGYYTILVDKWHLGYNEDDEDLGLLPTQQGFHVSYDWMATICEDEPREVGDEHMVDAYEWAVNVVNNRPWVEGEPMPYALFFHTITPHRRHGDQDPTYYPAHNDGYLWWRVHEDLIPLTKDLPVGHPDNGGDRARFIQNVEAIDTVIRAMLISLDVIQNDDNRTYRDASDTIIFFLADNGTDDKVSSYGRNAAKNSTFEGGIKVPLFVMGEGVPGNTQNPIEDTRLINHVDFFDTIADIVGASPSERDNEYGDFPRRGASFAYNIGWSDRAGADQ
ncbi:MAG: sulfatase-like hydrolase/transferase [Phycisphaerales bacterium]|nr:sulfatase-like hydrolase/transferase [Phycisphaerales bacterium]